MQYINLPIICSFKTPFYLEVANQTSPKKPLFLRHTRLPTSVPMLFSFWPTSFSASFSFFFGGGGKQVEIEQ